MYKVLIALPLISSLLSFFFAALLLRRYAMRRGPHLLLWGIGMVFYGVGGFCEFYHGVFGWNPLVFRLWYLCGAMLVAAWLGQGTVYLLVKRKWANALMVVLALASLYGAVRVFAAGLDPSLMTTSVHTGSELSGHAITTSGVRFPLPPLLNTYGTLMLVGGALYSAWIFWRKRVLLHRTSAISSSPQVSFFRHLAESLAASGFLVYSTSVSSWVRCCSSSAS